MPSLLPTATALTALLLALPAAASAAAPASPATTAKSGVHGVLPWIVDDLPRALAEARARKLPIFVESWAPW